MENEKRLTDVNPIIRNLTAMKSVYDAIALDGMIKALEEAPAVYAADLLRDQWISVEERLPELIPCSAGTGYSEAVVVLTSGKKAMIAIWDGVDFICAASYWDAEGEQITHWLPLPELPEVDSIIWKR